MKIQGYITVCWPVSGIKSPADQDPVLYNIIITRSFAIKSPIDQDPELYNSIPARFNWYVVACLS